MDLCVPEVLDPAPLLLPSSSSLPGLCLDQRDPFCSCPFVLNPQAEPWRASHPPPPPVLSAGASRAGSRQQVPGQGPAQPRPNPSWRQPGRLSLSSSPTQHKKLIQRQLLEMGSVPLGQICGKMSHRCLPVRMGLAVQARNGCMRVSPGKILGAQRGLGSRECIPAWSNRI